MPSFDYVAVRPGKSDPVKGRIDADTERDARSKIRQRGETAVTIKEIRAGGSSLEKLLPSLNFGNHGRSVLAFTGQLQRLIRSGITLTNALQVLSAQTDSKQFGDILKVVYTSVVERGNTFADALAEHPKVFSKLYVSMVRAGETTGSLPDVLLRLADYSKKKAEIESKIKTAMIYPIIVGLVALGIVIFLLNYLVPQLLPILERRGSVLPTSTKILLVISEVTQNYWWALIIVGLVVFFALRFVSSTKGGALALDRLRLKIPILGDLAKKACISRFAITLSSLLKSGVKIEAALRIVEEVVGNAVVAKMMKEISEGIREGESISAPLEKSGIFPKMVTYMISVGESAGSDELQETLDNVAEDYDLEIEQTATRLTSILPVLMLFIMAGVVSFILMAVLVPLMNVSSNV
jgi:type II secretory pathway component PulF